VPAKAAMPPPPEQKSYGSHTMRSADGSWPFAFGDVQGQVRLVGPNPGIGPTPEAACDVNPQGDLHICAIDQGHAHHPSV
jgi:hypothetical protein